MTNDGDALQDKIRMRELQFVCIVHSRCASKYPKLPALLSWGGKSGAAGNHCGAKCIIG
jgi:hypothetical protein